MFTDRDRRILYQIPALVVAITSIKAAAQYFQNVHSGNKTTKPFNAVQQFRHALFAKLSRT